MATAADLGLRQGDIVRVAIPVRGYEQYFFDICGEPPSRRICEGPDMSGGPRVGVISHDVRFDPRYGRAGPHTRVMYLDPSPTNGKVAGDVVDLGPGYAGFIPPVERGDSAAG